MPRGVEQSSGTVWGGYQKAKKDPITNDKEVCVCVNNSTVYVSRMEFWVWGAYHMLLKLTNNLKFIFNHCHQIFKIVHYKSSQWNDLAGEGPCHASLVASIQFLKPM